MRLARVLVSDARETDIARGAFAARVVTIHEAFLLKLFAGLSADFTRRVDS